MKPLILHIALSGLAAFPSNAFLALKHNNAILRQQRPLPASPYLSADKVFLDIGVNNNEIGRMVFSLTIPSPLPKHAEHFLSLVRGDRRSIEPTAHYERCQFDFNPDYIESEARYRWSHVCRGRSADTVVVDPENQAQCVHSCFGGQYYGDKYYSNNEDNDQTNADNTVVLTVAIAGPGRGSSRFSIVRVGESPPEWGERLLLNSGVIGKLIEGHEVLRTMARQRMGPPTILKAGIIETQQSQTSLDTSKEQQA